MNCLDVVKLVEGLVAEDVDLKRAIEPSIERYGVSGETLSSVLSARVPTLSQRNDTDWNYSRCFSFEFLLEPDIAFPHMSRQGWIDAAKNRSTPLYSVVVDVSAVAKVFYLTYRSHEMAGGIEKSRVGWKDSPFSEQHQQYISPITKQLVSEGFEAITTSCLNTKVLTAKMELSEEDGYTTLNDCIFHDGYGGGRACLESVQFTEY